jgi:hypothetical protein
MRQMVLSCRLLRQEAEARGDQRRVDFLEENLRVVRRAFIAPRRLHKTSGPSP